MTDIPQTAIAAAATAVLAERGLVSDGSQKWALRIVATAIRAAAPHIAAAERERIRQLADNYEALRACLECGATTEGDRAPCCPESFWFADMLTEGDPR